MITTVFFTLLVLAIVAVALGITSQEPYFTFVGLFFLFNLGIVLFVGGFEYQTGEDITTSYTYVNGSLNDTVTTVTDVYTAFSATAAHWYGFLLSLVSGIGAFMLFWDLRNSYAQKQEDEK